MSGLNRTFVLQAVGVAVIVGVLFFAVLRPTELGELAGIDAPGRGDGPTFVIPGNDRKPGNGSDNASNASRNRNAAERQSASTASSAGASVLSPAGGSVLSPAGDGPADDQYTDAATALMDQIRASAGETAR